MAEKQAYIPPHLRKAGVTQRAAADSASSKVQFTPPPPNSQSIIPPSRSGTIQFGYPSNYRPNDRVNNGMSRSSSLPNSISDQQITEMFESNIAATDVSVYESAPVEVHGAHIEPITQFPGSGIDNEILLSVAENGYKTPTSVQKYAIPAILSGLDLIVTSQTGSGKTAAFMLPVLTKIAQIRSSNPLVLNLVPTRELALQEQRETEKFCKRSHLRSVCIYGGASMGDQIRELRYGANILIATPGRLIDIMQKKLVSLSEVKYLILDECDRMLDMGFEPQIRQIIMNMDMPSNEFRQNLLFSATFPRGVQALAQQFMRQTVSRIDVGAQEAPSLITQRFIYVPNQNKFQSLLEIIKEVPGQTLVFAERRNFVDDIENYLYDQNLAVVAIHGERDMRDRTDALDLFTTGRATIMVATDVAARGLDIPNVTHVVNLDLPTDYDTYTHRIGRTGRAGHKGLATSFWNETNIPLVDQILQKVSQKRMTTPDGLEDFYAVYGNSLRNDHNPKRGGGSSFGRGGFRRDKSYGSIGYNHRI